MRFFVSSAKAGSPREEVWTCYECHAITNSIAVHEQWHKNIALMAGSSTGISPALSTATSNIIRLTDELNTLKRQMITLRQEYPA